jgi:hypothetical protein
MHWLAVGRQVPDAMSETQPACRASRASCPRRAKGASRKTSREENQRLDDSIRLALHHLERLLDVGEGELMRSELSWIDTASLRGA